MPWEDVFESIEPEPLAAGTIGQVHRARARERRAGRDQGAAAERGEEIERDLGLLELFAEKARGARGLLRRWSTSRRVVEHLSASLRRELDFREEAANIERMREVLGPYTGSPCPACTPRALDERLLVMDEVVGRRRCATAPPGRRAPRGGEAAARGLLPPGAGRGLLPRRPAPGQPALEPRAGSTCSTSAWSASSTPTRASCCSCCCSRSGASDAGFLADVLLMLGERRRATSTSRRSRAELAAFVGQFQVDSFSDIELGPMLDGMIADRAPARRPAAGLARADRQGVRRRCSSRSRSSTRRSTRSRPSAASCSAACASGSAARLDPQKAIYEVQKLKVRATRLIEGIERLTGARPGAGTADRAARLEDAGGRDPQGRPADRARLRRRGDAAGRGAGGGRLVDRPLGAGHARRRRRASPASRSCSTSAGHARYGVTASGHAAPEPPRAASSAPR